MLLVITGMWNISITIISPAYATEWKVHHDSVDPDVVIISNGHHLGFLTEVRHYTSSRSTLQNAEKVVMISLNTKYQNIYSYFKMYILVVALRTIIISHEYISHY